jgi:hypothetical protein
MTPVSWQYPHPSPGSMLTLGHLQDPGEGLEVGSNFDRLSSVGG